MSTNEDEVAREQSITAALMELLEAKLNSFMERADLSESPPEDKIAIRAAFFLGVNAGMHMSGAITGDDN